MGKAFVKDIQERDQVEAAFLVVEKAVVTSKNGTRYIRLRLRDRTGEIEGRIWEEVDQVGERFQRGDLVMVRAEAVQYQGKLQLNVVDLQPLRGEDLPLEDFLPPPRRDPVGMLEELKALAGEVEDPHLRRLVMAFLRDEGFLKDFLRVPASKGLHHARVGGLLEHTLSVATLVKKLRGHYPGMDWDLLMAGAILHDVGKVREIQLGPVFDYSSEGKLLGHIILGVEMVSERIRGMEGFPQERAMLLKHLLVSHHGRRDWGSPEVPKTPEAELLHRLDDLDAKVDGIMGWIASGEGEWTDYHRAFERSFFRGEKQEG